MQRLTSIDPAAATGQTADLFAAVRGAFVVVPNVATVLANSPAALDAFLKFSTAWSDLSIGGKLHHQIKQAVSEANACDYCKAVLTALGPAGGLTPADLVAGRSARSADPKTDAALRFARAVNESRGGVTDADLAAVRAAGFTDQAVVEIVTSVVLGTFTNFVNKVADTTLDVPAAEPLAA